MLANLDNEVHFKNVFTNVEVFTAFVKDVLGIEIHINQVETEKVLPSVTSPIKFRMDLFAEDEEQRLVVEIQKVDYDYTYDRFSHYFHANLIDNQRSSRDYAYAKDVYVIVVVTSAYKVSDKYNKPIKEDVLITDTNPRTLEGRVIEMHDHKMVILNTCYVDENTPKEIGDWLDLINESMKKTQDVSKINTQKKAIAKAKELAELNELTPEQLAEAKEQEMRKAARAIREQNSRTEGIEEGEQKEKDKRITKVLKRGKLTIEEIAEDFEVSVEYVLELKKGLE